MDRVELIKILDVLSSGLAVEGDSLKVFQNFAFSKEYITSYNDVVAVRIKNPTIFQGQIPGRLLLRFLKSCTAKTVEFTDMQKESKWRVKCGGTKLDFSYEEISRYPFAFPSSDDGVLVNGEDNSFFEALDLCTSVISEKGMVAWTAGVVCEPSKKSIKMGATNGTRNLIHIYRVRVKIDLEREFILPGSFCKIIMSISKMLDGGKAEFNVQDNYAVMRFDDGWAEVFGRLIVPDVKVDLLSKAQALLEDVGELVPIGDKLREILNRAASIVDKDDTSLMTIDGDKRLTLSTKAAGGVVRDSISLSDPLPEIKVRFDPRNAVNKMDQCSKIAVIERFICMKSEDGRFVRLSANKV